MDQNDFDLAFANMDAETPAGDKTAQGNEAKGDESVANDAAASEAVGADANKDEVNAEPGDDDVAADGDDPQFDDDGDDPDKWSPTKILNAYKSLNGRVPALQRELAKLTSQQRRQPEQKEEPAAKSHHAPHIPPELLDDFKTAKKGFLEEYPDAGELFDAFSGDKRFMKTLEELGPDAALDRAEVLFLRESQRRDREMSAHAAQIQKMSTHHERLLDAAPSLADVAMVNPETGRLVPRPGKQDGYQAFFSDIDQYIASLPYAEAQEKLFILREQGTPAQVASIIQETRAFKSGPSGGTPHGDPGDAARKKAAAAGATAVKTRKQGAPPVKPKDDKDDFDAGWNGA